jgi:hypothetical protein
VRAKTASLATLGLVVCPLFAACDGSNTVIAIWAPGGGGATAGGNVNGGHATGGGGASNPPPVTIPDAGLQPESFYLEAESGVLSVTGWMIAADPVPSGMAASASYIEATEDTLNDTVPGNARASYDFTLSTAGAYIFWGRIHTPDATHNRFWFRIDEQTWFLWRMSTGDVWYWDDFHNNTDYNAALIFPLAAGPHRLEIANAKTLARLDQIYVTSAGDAPPGNDTECSPPHSIEMAGACVRSCGSHAVNVTCDPTICATREQLEAYDCAVCCVE